MMKRRDALRLLAASAAIPFLPGTMLGALRSARAELGAAATPRTLNAHQDATVRAMAEMLIPRTDTPGAADAGAAEFIDLMLTEWYDDPARTRFLQGLAEVDAAARTAFGKDFVSCSAEQQSSIMTVLGEQVAGALEREREHPRSLVDPEESRPPESFYLMFRRLTLTAYYTSEVGATDELHFEIIPDRYDGCIEAQSAKGEPSAK